MLKITDMCVAKICLFLFMSSSLWSMSDTVVLDKAQENSGVTLQDIVEQWQKHSANRYNAKKTFKSLGWLTFASIAIPGAGPGIFLAGISCDEFFKQGPIPYHAANILCPTGLALCSVPVLLTAVTLLSYPAIEIINFISRKMTPIKGQTEFFIRGRDLQTLANYDDILGLGTIFFWTALLPKLNTAQALALAEDVGIEEINTIKNHFSDEAKINVNKLLRMSSMDKEELRKTITAEKMIKRFLQHPHLWQSLIRTLPDDMIADATIKAALTNVLKKILTKINRNADNADDIFDILRRGDTSLDFISQGEHIFLSLKSDDNDVVQIFSHRGLESINRHNLIEVSHYFETILANKSKMVYCIDLNHQTIEPYFIDVVLDIAQKKYPHIGPNNVLSLLQAANNFSIPWLFQQCDAYIQKNNLFEKIFADSDEKKPGGFGEMLAFSKKYNLSKSREMLLMQLDRRLSAINNIDNFYLLSDLKFVDEKDFIFFSQTKDLIERNVNHEYFLTEISKFAYIPFIKELLVNYFAKKTEKACQTELEAIFAIPPPELVEAIEAKRKNLTPTSLPS